MLGKKLTQILGALDRTTFRELGRAVRSPIMTTDESLVKLYDFLAACYPGFSEEKLNREDLYAALYPGKTFKDGTLRVKLRQFTQLVEDFLAWRQMQQDSRLRQRMLLEAYSERDLYDLFARETDKAVRAQEASNTRDLDYFQHQSALLYQWYYHPSTDKYSAGQDALDQLSDAVDSYFVLAKFRQALATKNLETILARKYPLRFWESIKEEHESGLLKGNPVAELYLQLFRLLETNSDEDFELFKEQFRAQQGELPQADLPSIYYTALNFLSRQINRGRAEYYPELLEWYQLGLTEDLLLSRGQISEVTFNNIVLLGYRSGAFDWTDSFVEEYADRLDVKVVKDAVAGSRGLGCFYRGQFANAIAELYNHQFSRAYQLRIRLTIIRAMYEQFRTGGSDYDRIMTTIQSFEAYMKRNKTFAERILQPYRNHLYLLRGLLQLDLNRAKTRERKAWLEQALLERPNVIAKEWLQKKV